MTTNSQELGELGERIAERWLCRQGWQVVVRRFRSGHRDIDLIVERDRMVVFVEVKARRGSRYGDPVEAVDWRKQRALSRSAKVWIDRFGCSGQSYRFDVVGVLIDGDKAWIRHVENAFYVHATP